MLALVTGCVLELHIREILGDLVGRVHVAEGRCEDDVAAGAREALDGALGIGAFRHAFEVSGFDLVAEFFFRIQAALIVLIGPAEIAHRADIDETGLDLVHARGACWSGDAGKRSGRGKEKKCFFHGLHPVWLVVDIMPGYFAYRSGTKDLPSEAGVLMSVILRFSDMITSTAIVAR
jgi:hypothetical protein